MDKKLITEMRRLAGLITEDEAQATADPRAEILRDYQVNAQGVITSPGKFEGEMLFVPYIWSEVLDGGDDSTVYVDDVEFSYVIFQPEDKAAFPEIGNSYGMVLWERSDGLVETEYFETQEEYTNSLNQAEADSSSGDLDEWAGDDTAGVGL